MIFLKKVVNVSDHDNILILWCLVHILKSPPYKKYQIRKIICFSIWFYICKVASFSKRVVTNSDLAEYRLFFMCILIVTSFSDFKIEISINLNWFFIMCMFKNFDSLVWVFYNFKHLDADNKTLLLPNLNYYYHILICRYL